jgi:prepilin-type processing-associated H-X9-DG protein
MSSRKLGLSLIEIAVIAAVVIVVVLILIPLISGARVKSSRSSCQSNMTRIAEAIQAYSKDNNGLVPPAQYYQPQSKSTPDYVNPPAYAPSTPAGRKALYPAMWTGRLRSYIRDTRSFICPLVSDDMADNGYFYKPKPSTDQSPWTTYGMNWRFSNGGALGGEPLHPKKEYVGAVQPLDSSPIPGQTVLLIETQNKVVWRGSGKKPFAGNMIEGGNVTPYSDKGEYFWAIRWLDGASFVPYGHAGGCNVVLADGHSAFVPTPSPPFPPKTSQVEKQGLKWW